MSAINRILVVGGGTAGWLSAAVLAKELNANEPGGVSVTLVESPDVPILGVGEGTWPTLRATLSRIGVDEGEFMRECEATFKQGGEFVNWVSGPGVKKDSYYHPFSVVFNQSYEFSLAPYWLLGESGDLPYDRSVSVQSLLCDAGVAPKKITTPAFVGLQEYAYHLNANKFADFLRRHCVEKLNVKHLVANVTRVDQDESDWITVVNTDRLGELEADFFIDCSGSRSLIIEGVFASPWRDIRDIIFNDRAVALQVPYETADAPIATHTIATAHGSGWTWDIGLQHRRGVGHVYSSDYISDDEAESVLRDYAGPQARDIPARRLAMRLGYREQGWCGNCVAIGMSAGFVEPLEASAIFLSDAAVRMLADQFPRHRDSVAPARNKFNRLMAMRWARSVEFIKLHYCISRRRDTPYWIDNCDFASVPEPLIERLEHWRMHPPSKFDFESAFEPFVLDSYLFVLYGMQFPTQLHHNRSAYGRNQLARERLQAVAESARKLLHELPTQRTLVDRICRYGMSSI